MFIEDRCTSFGVWSSDPEEFMEKKNNSIDKRKFEKILFYLFNSESCEQDDGKMNIMS